MHSSLIKRGLLVGALVAAAAAAAATPALASGCPTGSTCNGSTTATLTIPASITLTVNTSSIAFSGAPGTFTGTPPSVSTNVVSNDGAGYLLTVTPATGGQFDPTKLSVAGAVQATTMLTGSQCAATSGFTATQGFPACAVSLPSPGTALTVDSNTGISGTSGDSWNDYYGFVQASGNFFHQGNPIPNLPGGSYSDVIDYIAVGN